MDEIKALEEIHVIMSRFTLVEQRRMIWWLNARIVQRKEKEIMAKAELATFRQQN